MLPRHEAPASGLMLTGVGLVSAVGDDAESTAASIESGLAGMRTIAITDRGGNPLTGCPAIEIDPALGHLRRLWSFAVHAASQALRSSARQAAPVAASACHIFWTLPSPSRAGHAIQPEGEWLDDFILRTGLQGLRVSSHQVRLGHVAGLAAVAMAQRVLAEDEAAICLVGGVDSLLQLRLLRALERADRLKTELRPDGLIPGEAAAFLLLESGRQAVQRGAAPLCRIEQVAREADADPAAPTDQARAERMTRVLRGVLPDRAEAQAALRWLHTDLNGESVRALEWGLASIRVLDVLGIAPEILHPADSIGDVGAVSSALNVALAALRARDSEPGSRFIVLAAGENGERGALAAVRLERAPAPQLREDPALPDRWASLLGQNLEDLGFLWQQRRLRLAAPRTRLRDLALLDRRQISHLRALILAGAAGRRLLDSVTEPSAANVYCAASVALATPGRSLEALCDAAAAKPADQRAVQEATEFASPHALVGIVHDWGASADALRRGLALSACVAHGIDPGRMLAGALHAADPRLRATALRAAGELGRIEWLDACLAGLADDDRDCRLWAARSALLLGDRDEAIALIEAERHPPATLHAALATLLRSAPCTRVRSVLAALRQRAPVDGRLIRAVGIGGDPHYLPWLIDCMQEPLLARPAGEAFAGIVGLDLERDDMSRKPLDGEAPGPSDDPADERVAMDEDEGLPWPDVPIIAGWWKAHAAHFPPGARCFMGAAPSAERCRQVLATGFQPQRAAAAEYLALLAPGAPLFNAAAPQWRQQRLLAKWGAATT